MSVPQLPLALRYPPDQRLDTFVARARRDASSSCARWRTGSAARDVRADNVYLAGPAGVGKTHLLLATCAADRSGRAPRRVPAAGRRGRPPARCAGSAGRQRPDRARRPGGHRRQSRRRSRAVRRAQPRARRRRARWSMPRATFPMRSALGLPDLRSRLGAVHAHHAGAARRRRPPRGAAPARAAARTGAGRSGAGLAAQARRSRPGRTDRVARSPRSRLAGGAATHHGAVPAADAGQLALATAAGASAEAAGLQLRSSVASRSGVPTSVQRPRWCSPLMRPCAMCARRIGARRKRGGVSSAPASSPMRRASRRASCGRYTPRPA